MDNGRLARGRTIANTGKVLRFEVRHGSDGGQVNARVAGSYSPYYNVQVEFVPLTSKEKARVVDCVQRDPVQLGKVLNGDVS